MPASRPHSSGARWSAAAILVVCIVLLQAAVAANWISPFLVPPPSKVLEAIVGLFRQERLVGEIAVTFGMTFAAVAIGAVVGTPAGYLLYRSGLMRRAFLSWVTALFSAPMVLLYPLFVVVFGRNSLSMIMLGACVAAIPITLNTQAALLSIPRVIHNVGRSFRTPRLMMAMRVILPAAAPTYFVGIRLALIYALVNIVATGFLIDFGELGGLGNLIATLYDRYDIPAMYAAITSVVIISVMFFWLTERFERWLRPE
jgi:NitT/TauT family transport system permease protein